jgi:hypothetical protein
MNHQDCRTERLASSEVGHVTVCQGCGQVHLTLEYITLHFEGDAFRALVNMVSQAQSRLAGAMATDAAKVPLAAAGGLH